MLKTLQEKQEYIQKSRAKNYQASLALEGIMTPKSPTQLDKNQLKEKYLKLAAASRSSFQ